jgi:hypothetical protein
MSNYNKKKIVILDHGQQKVMVYDYNENVWDSPEDMMDENGNYILDSNCEWMVVNELNIEIK